MPTVCSLRDDSHNCVAICIHRGTTLSANPDNLQGQGVGFAPLRLADLAHAKYFILPLCVLNPVALLRALGIIKTIQRADEVSSDAAYPLEFYTFSDLSIVNNEHFTSPFPVRLCHQGFRQSSFLHVACHEAVCAAQYAGQGNRGVSCVP